jgi:hypothetical protein
MEEMATKPVHHTAEHSKEPEPSKEPQRADAKPLEAKKVPTTTHVQVRHLIPDAKPVNVFMERLVKGEWTRSPKPDCTLFDQEVIRGVSAGWIRMVVEEAE